MKTNIKTLIVCVLTMIATISCAKDIQNYDAFQYTHKVFFEYQNMQSGFVNTSALNTTEKEMLLKMKNEEKLARDVYSALYQKWGNLVFRSISAAENNHLNAMINLLKYYGETDTVVSEMGTFSDASVQALYNDLLSKGSISIEEAYKTGALIEEMDIKDLKEGSAVTSNTNINMVFENLERGSRNHLRSFYNQLTRLGETYNPVYISQDEYARIVTSSMEKGSQYKMNSKRNGKTIRDYLR